MIGRKFCKLSLIHLIEQIKNSLVTHIGGIGMSPQQSVEKADLAGSTELAFAKRCCNRMLKRYAYSG